METLVESIIKGVEVKIIDGAMDEEKVHNFYKYVLTLPFNRVQKDFIGDPFLYFSTHFDAIKFSDKTYIGKVSYELLCRFLKNAESYYLYAVYLNSLKYGDMQFPHRDCEVDEKDVTILYYVNPFWDYKWGGETIFYKKKESYVAVLPKPGRFVIFPGNVEHKAGVPNIQAKGARLSLAFKYKLNQNK
ncbi:2OG-Fe(II) oxygenase [Sinomicrobium oceani]|uniref:2OG-Fe(II) oxygenase n=1 Tax=Sinomicrobium oceani TaxID=1150368 RepID=UPI00227ADB51|nr:2OG-Fe(II) oxygenase [Sinomicrobium oceani]